jgi:hypothetical protein
MGGISQGGRDQVDHRSKPAPGKEFPRPYLERFYHKKKAGGVAQGVGPELKPWYPQNRANSLPVAQEKTSHGRQLPQPSWSKFWLFPFLLSLTPSLSSRPCWAPLPLARPPCIKTVTEPIQARKRGPRETSLPSWLSCFCICHFSVEKKKKKWKLPMFFPPSHHQANSYSPFETLLNVPCPFPSHNHESYPIL